MRLAFDMSRPQMTSSPFTEKIMSSFTLAAKPAVHSLSPKKAPLSSSVAAVGISPPASSGISGVHKFPADRHVNTGSSFMKSDHISRLNFNSVSTSTVSTDLDCASHWLGSFVEVRSPTAGFTSSHQHQQLLPASSFSPLNSIDDVSPPILKPKIRRSSHCTPDKSPLVTSSSGDILPSVGLGEPLRCTDSNAVEFDSTLSLSFVDSDAGINSTSRKTDSADERSSHDRLSTKNTKPASASRHDSCLSAVSDHKNSHKIPKPSAKEKASSKSGARSAKQKAKSPAAAELCEKQRSELDDAFEAACRLPSTVRGQPPSSLSESTSHRSSVGGRKVRYLLSVVIVTLVNISEY